MKKYLKPAILPWFVLIAGGIGIGLRYWLLSTNVDASGLLVAGHPATILLWILTAVTAAVVVFGCLPLTQANKYTYNFPSSPVSAVGEAVLALCVLFSCIATVSGITGIIRIASVVTGFLSVPTLILCAVYRWKGIKPLFFFHGLVSFFWALRLISLYQSWSPEPQLQVYVFQLLANVCIMLSFYQRTAFDADIGVRKTHAITHLGAVFFSCLSLIGSKEWFLYGACILWAFTDLCRLTPMPNKKIYRTAEDTNHESA